MKLLELTLRQFRNIEDASFKPDGYTTVICGENGQGKTNLLEAVWLVTGSKSFRAARDLELVKIGHDTARLSAEISSGRQASKIDVTVFGEGSQRRGRFAKVNGVDYGRASEIAGIFTAVVFEPGHLNLVRGGPEGRRKFLDAALCQIYPGFFSVLKRYQKALTQKNAVLKGYREIADADGLLDVFDMEMAASGEEITKRRREYLSAAAAHAQRYYDELSSGKERLEMAYLPACETGGLGQLFRFSRPADVRAGFCTKGPHREDFDIVIDGKSAKTFGSRGQQRSAVLALKLAEASRIFEITGDEPVMLLDDVLSELDEERQAYFLSRIEERQCIITTCDSSAFGRVNGKIVEVKAGEIVV